MHFCSIRLEWAVGIGRKYTGSPLVLRFRRPAVSDSVTDFLKAPEHLISLLF